MSGSGAGTGVLSIRLRRYLILSVLGAARPVSCGAGVGTTLPGTAGRRIGAGTRPTVATSILVFALPEVNKGKNRNRERSQGGMDSREAERAAVNTGRGARKLGGEERGRWVFSRSQTGAWEQVKNPLNDNLLE